MAPEPREDGLHTCDGVVALQGQCIVLAGAGAHQVESALAASCRKVADILESWADRGPRIGVGVIALYLHHIQGGTYGARKQEGFWKCMVLPRPPWGPQKPDSALL